MIDELLDSANRQGRILRYVGAPICFAVAAIILLALSGSLLLAVGVTSTMVLPAEPETWPTVVARSVGGVAAAALFFAVGQKLMSLGTAFALRAGQLEDLKIFLLAYQNDKRLAKHLVRASCRLRRSGLEHVLRALARQEGLQIPASWLAKLRG
jgi:hypothetical protein